MSATLAADLGGTKTLVALVEDGRVRERRLLPTDRDGGPDCWTRRLAEAAGAWQGVWDRVGVAVTGAVRGGTWSALNPGTLPIPEGYPLARRLHDLLGCEPVLVNDAQAAAWGEYVAGAGRGRDMAFLTVSTGIGGGLVLGGRLVRGHRGLGGSFGQMPGADGVRAEDLASGRAIAEAAARAGHPVEAPAVFAAAEAGEAWAEAVVSRAAVALARLCRAVLFAADPEAIVLGGGVGLAAGHLERVAAEMESWPAWQRPVLRRAALGPEAGVIGVAALAAAAEQHRERQG